MQLTKEEFEEKLREIEKLQDDVEKFLNERNFFVKIFGLKKAIKAHLLAGEKLAELYKE